MINSKQIRNGAVFGHNTNSLFRVSLIKFGYNTPNEEPLWQLCGGGCSDNVLIEPYSTTTVFHKVVNASGLTTEEVVDSLKYLGLKYLGQMEITIKNDKI